MAAEQVDEAVARGKIDPGLPFRLGHARGGHSRYGYAIGFPPLRNMDL
jgi:hypothetical protein